ncbi:MAG: hypothetical protein GY699_16470 [Desulfobacteraceae bacterium]|nr:hypothetical protein [Desulfobacteraceae bacterium]
MKKFKSGLLFLCLAVGLCGCIRQDLAIHLNSDGSGQIVLKSKINVQEQMLKSIEPDSNKLPKFKHLTLKETFVKKEGGQWYVSIYRFENLGRALPELEHEIPMMPRFTVKKGLFEMSLNRERETNEGFQIGDKEYDDLFYHLSITFPVPPTSIDGKVSGKTVRWEFDGTDIKTFKNMKIGTRIAHAQIPASRINVDIQPRFLGDPARERGFGKSGLTGGGSYADVSSDALSSYYANIHILGEHNTFQDGLNGSMVVNFTLDTLVAAPFSYTDLKLKSLVIDGSKIESAIDGEQAGVFTGTDRWGRKLSAFPVKIRFKTKNAWPQKIDKLEISLKVESPTQTRKHLIAVNDDMYSKKQIFAENKKLIITRVEHGSSTAAFPGASIDLVTNCSATSILGVYLDTRYGLRYAMNVLKWKEAKLNQIWDKGTKAAASELVNKDGIVYLVSLGLDHIPNLPFNLMINVIEKRRSIEKKLKLEAIHVSKSS